MSNEKLKNNKIALSGFMLGIISIPLFFVGAIPIIGLLTSIIGIFTFKKEKQKNRWMAISGIILCFILTIINSHSTVAIKILILLE